MRCRCLIYVMKRTHGPLLWMQNQMHTGLYTVKSVPLKNAFVEMILLLKH